MFDIEKIVDFSAPLRVRDPILRGSQLQNVRLSGV